MARYQLRSMQIILQATHGIVSGEPDFFKRAFGDTAQDYERILLMPHDYHISIAIGTSDLRAGPSLMTTAPN